MRRIPLFAVHLSLFLLLESCSGVSAAAFKGVFEFPLFFPPAANNVKISGPFLQWDLRGGNVLILGNKKIKNDIFSFSVQKSSKNILLNIKNTFFSKGDVRVIGSAGQILFEQGWASKKPVEFTVDRDSHFMVCLLDRKSAVSEIAICTAWQKIAGTRVRSIQASRLPTVLLGKKEAELSGQLKVGDTGLVEAVTFVFSNGTGIQLKPFARKVEVLDLVRNGNEIQIQGTGEAPTSPVQWSRKRATHFWSSTMGDGSQPSLWKKVIPHNQKRLFYLGDFDVPFTMHLQFDFERLPNERERVFLSKSGQTYSSHLAVQLSSQVEGVFKIVSSSASGSTLLLRDKSRPDGGFEWNVKMGEKGEFFPRRVKRVLEDREQVSEFNFYRGRGNELSGRFSVVPAAGGAVLLGEISTNLWFETLFGSQHPVYGFQRWGLSLLHSTRLDVIEGPKSPSPFVQSVAIAHYNLFSGLNSWNSSWGLSAAVNHLQVDQVQATLLGLGGYWARSLPKIFDRWLSYAPFLNGRSKWVDMEFLYFPLSTTGDTSLGANYMVNFHGKVFWTPTVFVEAGFSFTGIQFFDRSEKILANFDIFRVTGGLGWFF